MILKTTQGDKFLGFARRPDVKLSQQGLRRRTT